MNRRSFLKLAGIGAIAPFVPLGLQQLYEPVCAPIEITQTKTSTPKAPEITGSAAFVVNHENGELSLVTKEFSADTIEEIEISTDWLPDDCVVVTLTGINIRERIAVCGDNDTWTIGINR